MSLSSLPRVPRHLHLLLFVPLCGVAACLDDSAHFCRLKQIFHGMNTDSKSANNFLNHPLDEDASELKKNGIRRAVKIKNLTSTVLMSERGWGVTVKRDSAG